MKLKVSDSNADKKDESAVSEKVTVNSNEVLVDGKVVSKEQEQEKVAADKAETKTSINYRNIW